MAVQHAIHSAFAGHRPIVIAAAAPAVDVSSRLASLAELHSQGKLTDEEYAAAKAQVLAGG